MIKGLKWKSAPLTHSEAVLVQDCCSLTDGHVPPVATTEGAPLFFSVTR